MAEVLLSIPEAEDITDGLVMEQQQQEEADDVIISIHQGVDTPEPVVITPQRPHHMTPAQQKAMFKLGFLIVLVTIYGASNNPPIPPMAMTNKVRGVLSLAYSVAVYATLAAGALQLVLATLASRVPQLVDAANTAAKVGLVCVRVMLGYGASLVLLAEASPWFVLYVIFLSITFFM